MKTKNIPDRRNKKKPNYQIIWAAQLHVISINHCCRCCCCYLLFSFLSRCSTRSLWKRLLLMRPVNDWQAQKKERQSRSKEIRTIVKTVSWFDENKSSCVTKILVYLLCLNKKKDEFIQITYLFNRTFVWKVIVSLTSKLFLRHHLISSLNRNLAILVNFENFEIKFFSSHYF